MVSGETIKSGVINAIKAAYPDIDIAQGTGTQGTFPCFFVRQQEVTWEPKTGNRAKRKYTLEIRYQQDTGGEADDQKLDEVGNQLFTTLRKIDLADGFPVFSSSAGYKIADQGLRFAVSYQINTIQEKPPEAAMQSLEDSMYIREYKQERND